MGPESWYTTFRGVEHPIPLDIIVWISISDLPQILEEEILLGGGFP